MKIVTLSIGHDYPGGTWATNAVENCILVHLATYSIEGATLTRGTGVWQGGVEPCTVVSIVVGQGLDIDETAAAIENVKDAAREIRHDLQQDCIMVTVQEADVSFL